MNSPTNSGPTPDECRRFFAEIFVALDENPRPMKVRLFAKGITVDLKDGNPVFVSDNGAVSPTDFRRRYLAEHPVPLRLNGKEVFSFVPTTGNRVKVRVA